MSYVLDEIINQKLVKIFNELQLDARYATVKASDRSRSERFSV